MATKKSSNSKTTTKKTVTKKDENVNIDIKEETKTNANIRDDKDSVDLNKLYSLMESLQSQIKDLQAENEALKEEKTILEENMADIEEGVVVEEDVYTKPSTLSMDDPNRKITIYQTTLGKATGLGADLSDYAGQTVDVTFAAVPAENTNALCILLHVEGVKVVE